MDTEAEQVPSRPKDYLISSAKNDFNRTLHMEGQPR